MLRLDPPVGQVSRYRMEIQSWVRGRMLQADTSLPTLVQIMHITQTVDSLEADARFITTVIDSSRMDAPGMGGMGQPGRMAGDMLRGATRGLGRRGDGARDLAPGADRAPGVSQLAVISANGTMGAVLADQASGSTASGSTSGEFVVDVSAGRLARMTTDGVEPRVARA